MVGTTYNLVCRHALGEGARTPAEVAGLTDHRWSMEELLTFPTSPAELPRWRGRKPRWLLEAEHAARSRFNVELPITASSYKNHSFEGCAGCLWLLSFRGSAKKNEICWDNCRAPKRHSMAAESENRLRECLIGELLGTSSRRSCKNLHSSRSGKERQKPLRASSLSAHVPFGGAPRLRR